MHLPQIHISSRILQGLLLCNVMKSINRNSKNKSNTEQCWEYSAKKALQIWTFCFVRTLISFSNMFRTEPKFTDSHHKKKKKKTLLP